MFEIDGHLAVQRDSTTSDYPCAIRIERNADGLARKEIRLYNAYASAIPVGQPCLVRYDGDAITNPYVISGAAASGTAVSEIVAIPQAAVPASSWAWFAIAGYVSGLVEGTTDVAKDHPLQFCAATVSGLTRSGTGTIPGGDICGWAREAQTTNSAVLVQVYLQGDRCSIPQAAS